MPANVESAAYANEPAWHREGVVLDTGDNKAMTVEEALRESGLDWQVEKRPCYAPIFDADGGIQEYTLIEDRFSVVRTADNKALGVVGKTWASIQNSVGFKIIEDVIEQATMVTEQKIWIEAAGSLDGGRKVWVLAHIDQSMQIAGEDYDDYLLFVNGHDGRTSVIAATTKVRVVCKNTVALALDTAERIVRVRHTRNAPERIKEAHRILGMRNKYEEELAKQGEWLVETSMNDEQFATFLEDLMPMEGHKENTPHHTMIGERRADLSSLYFDSATCAPLKGTRWGAMQAVIEYSDFKVKRQTAESALKAQWGLTATPIKDKAYSLLTA